MIEMKEIIKNKKYLIPIIFVALLVILRFPLTIAYCYDVIKLSGYVFNTIFINLTYVLTISLIIYERKNLSKFNITTSTIILLGVMPFIAFTLRFWSSRWFEKTSFDFLNYVSLIFAGILLILFFTSKLTLTKENIKKTLVNTIFVLIMACITIIIMSGISSIGKFKDLEFSKILPAFVFQVYMAAMSEEPLFRGFIWGYLRDFKWKEFYILIFQSALFMFGHIYYFTAFLSGTMPIFIFIRTFIAAFIFGLMVMKTKTISSSIITHGLINSICQFL